VCFDYDLCNNCVLNGVTTKQHSESHRLQTINVPGEYISKKGYLFVSLLSRPPCMFLTLTRLRSFNTGANSGYDSGDYSDEDDAEPLFNCPYCSISNFTEGSLVDHVEEDHPDETKAVVPYSLPSLVVNVLVVSSFGLLFVWMIHLFIVAEVFFTFLSFEGLSDLRIASWW